MLVSFLMSALGDKPLVAFGKRLIRFSAKSFVFGLGAALAVAGIIAVVDWRNNRPVEPKVWPENQIGAAGIRIHLTTKWQDGQVYYKFSVTPSDTSLATEFDRAARSNEPKSFDIHLADSSQFDVPGCELTISDLVPVVADNGLVVSMDVQGSSYSCSRSRYLTASSFYPQYRFPKIEKAEPLRVVPEKTVPVPNRSTSAASRKPGITAVVTALFSSIVKRCAFNVGTFPCGVGVDEDIAKLNQGDRVEILSDKIRAPDGTEAYEVKFQRWTGWVNARDLSLENGEGK